MAKQSRAVKAVRTVKKRVAAAKKKAAPARSAVKKARPAPPKRKPAVPRRVVSPTPPPAAPLAPRKPGFYEAVAIYERGVLALQRHDFQGAAGHFRAVLDGYPDERELLERARLYLRVCERETSRQPPTPKTTAERVYAATVALNSGDHSGAMDHLLRALGDDPGSDHAHYTMAVALGMRGRTREALDHLRQAIALNPENRALARQDPDLDAIRGDSTFTAALDTPPAPNRRRARSRR